MERVEEGRVLFLDSQKCQQQIEQAKRLISQCYSTSFTELFGQMKFRIKFYRIQIFYLENKVYD